LSSVSLSLFDIIKKAVTPIAAPAPIIAASLAGISSKGLSCELCGNKKVKGKITDRAKQEMDL
jgi:hypothetical protein